MWFVFAGIGSHWPGMGRKMMELDIFRESIQRSSKILSQYDVNLYDLIMNGDDTTFEQIIHAYIGIVSIQVTNIESFNMVLYIFYLNSNYVELKYYSV